MPNLQTHRLLTTTCAFATAPAILLLSPMSFAALELGVLVTLLPELTPDLDHSSRKFGAIGDLLGLKAYSELIPHRYGMGKKHWSRLRLWNIFLFSHIPFLGTFLRTLLCTLPILLILMFFGVTTIQFWQGFLVYFFWFWVGMSWSDCFHVGADLIVSDFKETRREWWYGKKIDERRFYRKTKRVQ